MNTPDPDPKPPKEPPAPDRPAIRSGDITPDKESSFVIPPPPPPPPPKEG